MNRGRQNGAFITVAGPRHASRLRAERRRVHRAGSRGPQHRPVSRETRSATDDASHVAARHEGRHLPSCKPASTHRPATRPAHSLEPRLPMKGPVRVSVGGHSTISIALRLHRTRERMAAKGCRRIRGVPSGRNEPIQNETTRDKSSPMTEVAEIRCHSWPEGVESTALRRAREPTTSPHARTDEGPKDRRFT
jgi:hypothetical protein